MDYETKYKKYKIKYNKIKRTLFDMGGGNIFDITFEHVRKYIFINLSLMFEVGFDYYKIDQQLLPVIYKIEETEQTYKCYTLREIKPTTINLNNELKSISNYIDKTYTYQFEYICIINNNTGSHYINKIQTIMNNTFYYERSNSNYVHRVIEINKNDSNYLNLILTKYIYSIL